VEKITQKSQSEVGKAIVCFQYVERIKSELIIAARLIERVGELKGEELRGASNVLALFLDSLLGEINIAQNVSGRRDFEVAGERVRAATEKAHDGLYDEAIRLVSEAISSVATSGQWAMQTLKENGFL